MPLLTLALALLSLAGSTFGSWEANCYATSKVPCQIDGATTCNSNDLLPTAYMYLGAEDENTYACYTLVYTTGVRHQLIRGQADMSCQSHCSTMKLLYGSSLNYYACYNYRLGNNENANSISLTGQSFTCEVASSTTASTTPGTTSWVLGGTWQSVTIAICTALTALGMGLVVVALIVLLCYCCLRARDASGAGKLRLDETRTDIIEIKHPDGPSADLQVRRN